ncbi:hypothetical protein P0Y35_15260 [Kiritimatiellaeota bacterium B1221]|nr:hypothetical protein [Kiritimatiellaeota bacterium B1221]
MSQYVYPSKFRLALLGGISFLLCLPATLLWGVNLDFAIRVYRPEWRGLEGVLPAPIYQSFGVYCDDLSTISTLIVVLLFLFPLRLGVRVWTWGREAPERLLHEIYDPYPPHFPFFLVMLGLAGTLYGLLIGLDVSGVRSLETGEISAEHLQQTFDQLLGGTATALLSSLLGLAGAFLAARPLTWLCHRAVHMPVPDESLSLEETFRGLIQDMQALGRASEDFREQLGLKAFPSFPQALEKIQDDVQSLREGLENKSFEKSVVDVLNLMQQHQQSLAAQQELQGKALIEKLSAMEEKMGAQLVAQQEGNQILRAMGDQLTALTSQQKATGEHASQQRTEVLAHLRQEHSDRIEDRSSLRQAFGKYLEGSAGKRKEGGS